MRDILGKYHIENLIAEGGMARIYRAKTEGVGGVEKIVALKCLKGVMSEDDNFVQMLLDEARITVRMSHKNIGQVYGLEHDGDTYFMVMELVDGVNLSELSNYLFSQNRVFPVEAAVFVTMEVCSGLSYAHRMTDDKGEPLGIVHRDVNPQNICISKEGEVKLIDFGIAKARRASSETQIGTIKGKFNYMSPEQARGERVDQRADVFALGAMLYEMLCGHMLYPLTLDDMRLRTKTRMADFVPIENYLPDIPDKLRRILAKSLARDVNQRFATSRDFLLALTQFFHDSCKVYDALNLSMLVEKFLSQKSGLKTHPDLNGSNAMGRGLASPVRVKKHPVDEVTDFAVDSGDTAIMSADEARRLATALPKHGGTDSDLPDGDTNSTAVYQQPSFVKNSSGFGNKNLEFGKGSGGFGRISAKFDTDNENLSRDTSEFRNATTEFEKAGEPISADSSLARSVDLDVADPGADCTVMVRMDDVKQEQTFADRLINAVNLKIQTMNERTLAVIAISLTVLLIIAIILFFHLSKSENKTVDNQGESAIEANE